MPAQPAKVTIRMFNVGFGDCFLLTFHYPARDRHVLIDFGSTGAGTLAGMRALWPRTFQSRMGERTAIVLIAIAFGAGHLPMGILAAAAAGVLGLFLGIILIVHRSIWPAVIAHGFFDATSFVLMPFALHKLQQLR